MGFQDHFGGHARAYAAHRPSYPDTLFRWVAERSPATAAVWDCATGNGQAARGLAPWFDHVHATDGSEGQIAAAEPHPGITFSVATAEASGLPDASVDAVTVAQALHWFDHGAFYDEVRRVLRPGGLLACWGYTHHQVTPEVDALIFALRDEIEQDWPAGREHLEARYLELPFPFEDVAAPPMHMSITWSAEDQLAYLRTWSAVKRHDAEHGGDIVDRHAVRLRETWGSGTHTPRWPIHWRVGRLMP